MSPVAEQEDAPSARSESKRIARVVEVEDPKTERSDSKRSARGEELRTDRSESKRSARAKYGEDGRAESKARWERRRTTENFRQEPELPAPLRGGRRLSAPGLEERPSCEALGSWLREHGVEAEEWKQQKGGKGIKDLWKEVKLQECGMELWETASGQVRPVRVVHVLRAKVCSPESYERNIFVFNRWQQFSDGRTRTRNGLLSEKLSVAEMPLEDHLHDVCRRAVTTEEMQRVEEAAFRVGPGYARPEHNPDYVCPITVADQQYIDHTVEIVKSASYPTLITLYHLYTVEIVCLGLPSVDFTTLEFDAPDESGYRKLKYVHGWCWQQWSQIQRYLFEGSELKDRKTKGSFEDALALESWLSNFDLELDAWGAGDFKSVDHLYRQVESGEAHLEHWGRHDGVPILMRVLHVVRLEVKSSDHRLLGQLLLQTWQQEPGSTIRTVNRLMTKVMNTTDIDLPFDEQRLKSVAAQTVEEKLGYLTDAHFRLDSYTPAMLANLQPSGVQIVKANLVDHHVSVDESPSYKGMCTMYHLYDMHVECQGLPFSEFASIIFQQPKQSLLPTDKPRVRISQGFRWVTWPSCIDLWQGQASANHRKQAALRNVCCQQQEVLGSASDLIGSLRETLERLAAKQSRKDQEEDNALAESLRLLGQLEDDLDQVDSAFDEIGLDTGNVTHLLPPSMVSTMSQSMIVSKETLDSAALRRMRLMEKLGSLDEEEMAYSLSTASGVDVSALPSVDPSAPSSSSRGSRRGSKCHQEQLEEAFTAADLRGSGTVSMREMEEILRNLSPDLSTESVNAVLAAAPSKEGTLNYKDFIRWLYGEHGGGA